jgi:hypothetical protein
MGCNTHLTSFDSKTPKHQFSFFVLMEIKQIVYIEFVSDKHAYDLHHVKCDSILKWLLMHF